MDAAAPLRQVELDDRQRDVCHALRDAARIVGQAALPAKYRADAFRLAAELELERLQGDRAAA